jgi:non-heme chloroperoxidase
LVRPLLPASWRVFAVTVRGHGLSDKPETGYDVSDFARDVVAFMDAVGVERAVLVGHSMSTAITLGAAAAYPERVSGVALMGAFARFRDTGAMAELKAAAAEIGDNCGREFAQAFQESTLANPIPPNYLETVINESLYMPGHAWRGAVQGLIDFEPVDAARKIHAPAAIIWGDKDAYCPRADQQELRIALRNSRRLTLAGVGHALHWERPADTAALLRAFIADIEEPAVLTHAFA